MPEEQSEEKRNIFALVNTWLLCGVLLLYATTFGFSFESNGVNTVVGSQLTPFSAGESQANHLLRLQTYGVYVLCALLMLPLIRFIVRESRRNALISSLFLWAALSCVWSNNARGSLIGAAELTLDIMLAIFLIEYFSINDLLKLLMLLGSVAAAMSLLLIALFPQYGLQRRDLLYSFGAWQGIFGQKNICGMMMTLLLLPALFVRLDSRLAKMYRAFYIIVVCTIIAMTQSVGAWVVCGSCLLFILVIRFLLVLKSKDAFSVGLPLIGMFVATVPAVLYFRDQLLSALGKDPTMTGRTILWANVMMPILKHPFVGYGYKAFWQGLSGASADVTIRAGWHGGLSYSESGVLDLWLELGAVGLLLYAVVYFRAVKDAITCVRRNSSPAILWCSSMLFFVVATNLEGGRLLTPFNLSCLLAFIAYLTLRREAHTTRELDA